MNVLARFVYDRLGESQQQIEYKCTVCAVTPVLAQLWFVCSFIYWWKGKGLAGMTLRGRLFSVDTDILEFRLNIIILFQLNS